MRDLLRRPYFPLRLGVHLMVPSNLSEKVIFVFPRGPFLCQEMVMGFVQARLQSTILPSITLPLPQNVGMRLFDWVCEDHGYCIACSGSCFAIVELHRRWCMCEIGAARTRVKPLQRPGRLCHRAFVLYRENMM